MIARRSPRPDALAPGMSCPRIAMPFRGAFRGLGRARAWCALALVLCGVAAGPASADVVGNWGAVITPVVTQSTFGFSRSGISQNFTDDYLFSLQGSAGATYSVTFDFGACARGCGTPALSYGIYGTNGGLVADTSTGSVTLAAGDYYFQVKGTGMGAGNTVDYSGSVTFAAAAAGTVSAAPEPSTYLLTLIGLTLVGWVGHRNAASLSSGARRRLAFAGIAGPRPAA
jgi:hypothetical protein